MPFPGNQPPSFGGELMNTIQRGSQLVIKQKRELAEIFLGFETRNRYELFDEKGSICGSVTERGGGVIAILKRLFFRSHRPFVIDVAENNGQPVLFFSRQFFFFFSDIVVTLPTGEVIGSAHRRFGIIRKIYDLRDSGGNTFGRIDSSIFKLWTFAVRNAGGTEVARISKKWGGVLREMFTDADSFLVEFGSEQWTPNQRAVIFAVGISIDFDFFDNNNG